MAVKRALGMCVALLVCSSLLNTGIRPERHTSHSAENNGCIFPFSYKDVTYFMCTSTHSDYSWCSLDDQYNGHWRYCTADDRPSCVFPFLYGRTLITSCTKLNYVLGRSWCSLTSNFNRDRKWKQCSPFNT